MHAYCVGELRLCEQAAFKRIHAARAARRFPAIFEALAEGRLHLTAVTLLAPHLTEASAPDLLAAAAHKSRSEIEQLLAERFPRTESLPMVETLPDSSGPTRAQLSPGKAEPVAQARAEAPPPPATTMPTSRTRFTLQLTRSQDTHDKLRYAQELLGHQIPNGDLAQVLERVLELAIAQIEKRKFAATDRPRLAQCSTNSRHIPAHVRRAVWKRDGGQCTFVGESGHRCESRTRLEFDHIEPVARGGQPTVDGIRLRCRAHNQYTAECEFGHEFMRRKPESARAAAEASTGAARNAQALAQERAQEVVPWLQALGIPASAARRAAERCESIPDASIEDRVRLALTCFGPRTAPPS